MKAKVTKWKVIKIRAELNKVEKKDDRKYKDHLAQSSYLQKFEGLNQLR